MASALDVAAYFLARSNDDEDSGISNLKLQKLIYYAQGYHLAIYGSELFPEAIEAWTHGPVCPDVYHMYKQFGSATISTVVAGNPQVLSQTQIEFLDEVYQVFGQFSAWKLRNMTHAEAPWLAHEADAGVIEQAELAEYFKQRLN